MGLTAVTDLLLVDLGRAFIYAAARWPSLLAEVHRRLESQRERLAIQAAIAHLPRADDRVLLVLWHLADTWGRVTAQGTLLSIRITHDVIGQLVGARRPTVTLVLGSLEQYIRRTEDGSWLLTPAAEARVRLITTAGRRQELLGASVMLRQLLRETRDQAQALRGEFARIRAHRRATAQQRMSS